MATLDATYPSAGETYTCLLSQADGAVADLATVFDEVEPGASIAITAPAQGSEVPPAMDLTARRTPTTTSRATRI